MKKRLWLLCGMWIFVGLMFDTAWGAGKHRLKVNCDRGQSLQRAVNHARPGTMIVIKGTCFEAVTIKKDGLTLRGRGDAAISGAAHDAEQDVLTVMGADNVRIMNLTLRDGRTGLVATGGAHLTATNLSVLNHAQNGIRIEKHSAMAVSDSEVSNAGAPFPAGEGIEVTGNASLSVSGKLRVEGFVFGIDVLNTSSLRFSEASLMTTGNFIGLQVSTGSSALVTDDASVLNASDNFLIGITVVSGSSLFVFEGDVTTNNNGLDGLNAFTNSNIDFDRSVVLTSNNNGRNGVLLEDSTLNMFTRPPAGPPRIEAIGNARDGVAIRLDAKLDMSNNAALNSTQNGNAGLSVDNGSFGGLMNANVSGNSGPSNMSLSFGSRADFISGNNIASLSCDGSVLSRGELSCP